MTTTNKFSITLLIFILGIIAYLIVNARSERKIGYVDIRQLYNGFDMKKQMEQRYITIKQRHDKILDSVKFELNRLLKKIEAEKKRNQITIDNFTKRSEQFQQTKAMFEEEAAKLTQQYDEQILVQLNQYVKDFGLKYKYDILLGNDDNGSLMFATDKFNCTEDVLEFINAKYNGIK